jgi:predicted nucleic acid-binding protein
MRFWDSSAIIPLLVLEDKTEYCISAFQTDKEIMVWTMSKVEVFSALCRSFKENTLTEGTFELAKKRMTDLFDIAFEIVSISKVKERALRLSQVHTLKAADALQLASVLVATQEVTSKLPIMCFDEKLKQAAKLEGFVINPD